MNEERTDATDEQKASGSCYGRPFIDGLFGKNGHYHHDGGDNDDDHDGNDDDNYNGDGNDNDYHDNHHYTGMVDPGL